MKCNVKYVANFHLTKKIFCVIFFCFTNLILLGQADVSRPSKPVDSTNVKAITTNTALTTTLDSTKTRNFPDTAKKTTNLSNNSVQSAPPASVECVFIEKSIDIAGVTALSNLLKLNNNTAKTISLSISMKHPSMWKNLFENEKKIILNAGDSAFLPVRFLSSNNKIRSGIKFQFIALIKNLTTYELYKPSFTASKEKTTQLKLSVEPGREIYFLNGENTAQFKINLENRGEYEEKMMVKIDKVGKNIYIKDSLGVFGNKNYNEFVLKPFKDSTIKLTAALFESPRNYRRVDTYGYLLKPKSGFERGLLFIKGFDLQTGNSYTTSLANGKDTVIRDVFKVGKSVRLIKLGDTKNIESVDNSTIPLTLIANAFNFINYQPSISILLFGNKQVDKYGSFNYFIQNNFSFYSISRQTSQSIFGQIAFNNNRVNIMVGNGVRLHMPLLPIGTHVSGTGISTTYHINKIHSVGVALSRNGRNINNFNSTNISIGYGCSLKRINFAAGFLNTNYQNGNNLFLYSGNIQFKINQNQMLSAFGGLYNYRFFNITQTGNLIGSNYNIRYYKNKAQTNLSFLYNRLPFVAFNPINNIPNSSANFNISLSNFLNTRKRVFSSNSSYMVMPTYVFNSNTNIRNVFLTNNIITSKISVNPVKVNPGIFFNYTNIFSQEVLSSGLIVNLMCFNLQENFRINVTSQAGYNKVINNSNSPNFFTAQINTFSVYRVWRLNLRYIYGPQFYNNITTILNNQQRYTQIFFSTLSHQHHFKNKHFIWENNFMYNYINSNRKNGIGLFSQLFFYSNNGWNFNLNCNINYNISDALLYSGGNAQNPITVETSDQRTQTYSFQLGLGVKKDFSIPIPQKFVKRRSGILHFKAFLDINGNRIYDKDEIELPNIVIKLDYEEVQTNALGEATFTNLKFGKYGLTVFPIEDIGPWFCVIKDTLNFAGQQIHYIPFSKGAQVSGDVSLERSESSKTFFENLDISRFTITLSDSSGYTYKTITDNRGFFSFYVPYGKYTLNFNENMLGKEFLLNENNIEVDLNLAANAYYQSFLIIEKQKKVKKKKFDADGNLIKDE